MSNEGYKVQASGDIGNGMWVFRGDTVDEVKQLMADAKASADEIYDNLQAIQQVALAKEAFSAKGYNKGGGGAAATPAGAPRAKGDLSRPAQQNTGGGNTGQVALGPDGNGTCPHGAKLLDYRKDGGSGVRVHGWYCQSKDKDFKKKCRPLTLDGHGE